MYTLKPLFRKKWFIECKRVKYLTTLTILNVDWPRFILIYVSVYAYMHVYSFSDFHGSTDSCGILFRHMKCRCYSHDRLKTGAIYPCEIHSSNCFVQIVIWPDSGLIDWCFISQKYTHIHINSTYRQIKSFICIQTYMYHLAAARETASSLSKLAAFRLVLTWLGHLFYKLII